MSYRYETHLHTSPVSKCGHATVRESLEFYKSAGYDGVFITNHFLDGNLNYDRNAPYEERIRFYCSDYEEGKKLSEEIGIKVFFGAELSYCGTDFLIYGLDKEWYLAHPEIMEMRRSEELSFMMESGALVIQAHPFRDAAYIDYIRLFPKNVHGVEIINAGCTEFENSMAKVYAEAYGLKITAGSDNHRAKEGTRLGWAGIITEEPLNSEMDYKNAVLSGNVQIFLKPKES